MSGVRALSIFVAFSFLLSIAAPALLAVPKESTLDGHLRWGSCRLDQERDIPWPILCVRSRAVGQLVFKQDASSENIGFGQARLYGGLHLWSYISAHGEVIAEKSTNLTNADAQNPENQYLKSGFVQLGNVALQQILLAAGKMEVPFGVNFRPLQEVYEVWLKDTSYWEGPAYNAILTWDNQRELTLTVSWASSELPEDLRRNKDQVVTTIRRAAAARASYDISALEGTRIVVSGYGDNDGERRMGAALVSITPAGEGGVFEWVRRLAPDQQDGVVDQLFRLGYAGGFYRRTRWLFEYEDAAHDYRLVTLGHDFLLPEYFMFRTAVSYRGAAVDDGDSYWFLSSGLQVQL